MLEKVMYECGCLSGGDNVAASCPVHGDSILRMCKYVCSCDASGMRGGFPICYDPWKLGYDICDKYEALE